jgi:hypothetical protein
MHTNHEEGRLYRMRNFASKRPGLAATLTGTFDIPVNAHEIYMFDAGLGSRTIRLPALTEEMSIVIGNIGAVNSLNVYNSANVFQVTLGVGDVAYFFSTLSRWVWFKGNMNFNDPTGFSEELRQITAAGAQVVSATEPGLVINKAVASATPVTLPLASARVGRPIRFVDWRGNVDIANPVTLTPSGADKINNLATWEASNLSSGGLILFPNTALGGYTVGA